MQVTNKELALIKAIAESEYSEGTSDGWKLGTWVDCLDVDGIKNLGGVISSLVKKDLVNHTDDAEGNIISLTGLGLAVYHQNGGKMWKSEESEGENMQEQAVSKSMEAVTESTGKRVGRPLTKESIERKLSALAVDKEKVQAKLKAIDDEIATLTTKLESAPTESTQQVKRLLKMADRINPELLAQIENMLATANA